MLELFFYFLFLGILMFIFDTILLKLRKELLLTSYLLSSVSAGAIIGMVMQSTNMLATASILPFILSITGGILLYLTQFKDLYKKPLFQMFGTIILGLSTGIIASLLIGIMLIFNVQLYGISQTPVSFFIDLVLYGFLLHFGYAFSGRISQTLFRK